MIDSNRDSTSNIEIVRGGHGIMSKNPVDRGALWGDFSDPYDRIDPEPRFLTIDLFLRVFVGGLAAVILIGLILAQFPPSLLGSIIFLILVLNAVIFIALIPWQWAHGNWDRRKHERFEEIVKEAQYQADLPDTLRGLSLTCDHCRALAAPIQGTLDRYRCEDCSHQFVGAKHGF
jgi:hypothetical protein